MSSESHQGIIALGSCTLGLSAITLALRFYSRKLQKVPLLADDWLMVPGLALLAGSVGCTFYGVHREVISYPTPKDLTIAASRAAMKAKLEIAFNGVTIATLGLTKLSALLFYRRIFCVPGYATVLKNIIRVSILIVTLWLIAFELLSVLQCGTHFSALWSSKANYIKYCEKTSYPFLLGYTISDFLLDLWIICLPIPKIWALKTSFSRKLGVTGVFLLALVSFSANIARLVVYVQIEQRKTEAPNAATSSDTQLAATKSYFFSVLEVGMACVAVNLPSLWFLASKVTPEAVLRTIRSMISLTSVLSNRSTPTTKDQSYSRTDMNGSDSSTWQAPPLRENIHSDTHAPYDLESSISPYEHQSISAL